MSIPRMRTLPEAVTMLREMDPGTAVTLTALRRMVKRGELPAVEIASKRLINFDNLLESLANPPPRREAVEHIGEIRRIECRGGAVGALPRSSR